VRLQRILDLGLSATFLGAILVVFALTDWSGRGTWVAEFEKRDPVQLPEPPRNLAAAATYLDRFGKFFSDHFGLRQLMIDLNGRIQIGLLHRSPSPQVIVGSNDFLFYTGQQSIEDYRRLRIFSSQELDAWAAGLKARRDWLASRGIAYLFVVAPNKNTVYPEDVPHEIHRAPGKTRVEQLAARLDEDPYFCDLTSTLKENKSKGLLFFKRDSHWNDLGAYTGYRAIMQQLGLGIPEHIGTEPAHVVPDYVPDLALIAGVNLTEPKTLRGGICAHAKSTATDPSIYGPGDPAYAFPATECLTGKEELLLFHDSFAGAMVPYLSDTFQRVVYVRRMPSLAELQKAVEMEHPTVVVEERVERLLMFNLR
jgi:hypothetical protein